MIIMKTENKTTEIFVLKETMWQSMFADAWGYGTLGLLFWFNHNYIGGSYIVNTIILILVAIKLGKMISPKKKYTIDEVIKRLQELKFDDEVKG